MERAMELNSLSLVKEVKELKTELKDCRNSLCDLCGLYKEAHNGACDGCRWRNI